MEKGAAACSALYSHLLCSYQCLTVFQSGSDEKDLRRIPGSSGDLLSVLQKKRENRVQCFANTGLYNGICGL